MRMKITDFLLPAALALLAGCDSDGTVRPPPTTVRVFNAAPDYEALSFLREARVEAQLGLGGGTERSFDSGEYDFHLEYVNGVTRNRVLVESFTETLSPDIDYLYVLLTAGGQLTRLRITSDDIEPSETTSPMQFVHAHPSFGAFDVYVVDVSTITDCQVAGTASRGSVDYGPAPVRFTLAPGTYRVCLTAPGDANTVLYQSSQFPIIGTGIDFTAIAHDTSSLGSNELTVSIMGSEGIVQLNQVGAVSELHVIQDVDDGLARDIFINEDTTPLFPAPLAAGALSDYVAVTPGANNIHLVPVGAADPESTIPISAIGGRRYMIIYAGDTAAGILAGLLLEDHRPVVGQASIRVIHAAGMQDPLQFFVRLPGSGLTNAIPVAVFQGAPGATAKLAILPGDVEITVRNSETQAIVAGPELITLEEKDVYDIIITNNPLDPATVRLNYYEY